MNKVRKQGVLPKMDVPNVKRPTNNGGIRNFSSVFIRFPIQAIILAAIAFVLYFNTFTNEYALDDVMVIQQNEYVHQGLKGIPSIIAKDTYDSYFRQANSTNELSGGRYRPLSVITFAIEEELLGKDNDENPALGQTISEQAAKYMHTRHVVNVLLYMLSVVVFLYFLRKIIFQNASLVAFVAALLFTIHPIHTEVVANIKSRDELLSFLFICFTFINAYKYAEDKKISALVVALVCYTLALFSKEYAIVMVGLIPLMYYLFKRDTFKNSIKGAVPFLIILAGYLLVRFSVVGHKSPIVDTDLQNNPYLYATGLQKITTEIATLLNYLKLLLLPYPLSADYSYNQIPYNGLSALKFWVSLAVHLGLVILGIRLFLKRNVLCFAIVFYLLNLLLVSNLLFDLGATMGERLIYHSSAGFVMAISWLLVAGIEKIKVHIPYRIVYIAIVIVLVVVSGYEVITRNEDWKNTNTLFAKDVQTVPASFLANGIAGVGYCAMSDLPENKVKRVELIEKGIAYLDRSIAINGKYVNGYFNRALAYNSLSQWDKQLSDLDSVKKYKPDYPGLADQYQYLYHDKGLDCWKSKKFDDAVNAFKRGCELAPKDPEMWYMLGITYYSMKDYTAAIKVWDVTLKLNPNHQGAKSAYPVALKFIGSAGGK